MNVALFPGSFDPLTIGHYEIVKRALPLFDEIRVGVGFNSVKECMFPLETRLQLLVDVFDDEPKVKVAVYKQLTAEYAKYIGANYIIRGIRNVADLEYERSIADINKKQFNVDTLFFIADPQYSMISSSILRDLYKYNADISQYIPKQIDIRQYENQVLANPNIIKP